MRIIVSRHPATVAFIAAHIGGIVDNSTVRVTTSAGELEIIPVVSQATVDDVRGKVVFGNLPLHLAAVAEQVEVVEFKGAPPRGQEYTLEDMVAAGATIRGYRVIKL